ncbi:MAG: MBL fold metallo-hydrolase [bacterium]|nr:MAG: MBL fold metallo-hydrolase [bacterium]
MSSIKTINCAVIIAIWLSAIYGYTGEEATPLDNNKEPVEETKAREARIWFLGHCGFALKTPSYFLIFDYIEATRSKRYQWHEDSILSTGYIDPEEIKDLKVRVFTTHEHEDHFDPAIFKWESQIADIEYFFGWQASDNPEYHYLLGSRAVWQCEDLEVYTIKSNHAGVPEVAYLVKVDGLVIYHNGDYQGDYEDDITYLKTKADSIDIAFLFCVWQAQWKYYRVNFELITRMQPKAAFPMHVRIGDEDDYFEPFRSTYEPMMQGGRVVLTYNTRGISFYYNRDQITQD